MLYDEPYRRSLFERDDGDSVSGDLDIDLPFIYVAKILLGGLFSIIEMLVFGSAYDHGSFIFFQGFGSEFLYDFWLP